MQDTATGEIKQNSSLAQQKKDLKSRIITSVPQTYIFKPLGGRIMKNDQEIVMYESRKEDCMIAEILPENSKNPTLTVYQG